MVQQDLQVHMQNGCLVIQVEGYFSKESGQRVKEAVLKRMGEGPADVVIDFQASPVLSSPGVAALLDVVLRIADDFRRQCVIVGLDRSKTEFLEITGVFPIADAAADVDAALELLNAETS